jgi:PBSX family phage terminase large subunit
MRLGSDKQLEFWREATHRWNIKVGATRSGKTYMDYFLLPKRIIERRGKEGLAVILGNTRETVRRNIIIPMQDIYGSKRVGNIRSDNCCYMFGERVFVLGADNANHVDRIRGTSIKYCYGDEVATWNREVFDMLKSRLDKPYSCFDGALNPQGPNHWLKEFLDSDADIYLQHYTIFDNPYLPKDFVDNLCKEYAGTVYYKRYILGEWALAEGLIYPMYEKAIEEAPGAATRYVLSVDYGTQNAFSAGLWGQNGDTWYRLREYYYSGRDTGEQKTDEEYAQALDDFTRGIGSETERLRTIIDPSAASFITLLRKRGRYRVIPADNAVADGIRETATAMQTGKIKVSPECKDWIREAQGYVWDEKVTDDDKPVKVNDHAMDDTRYFVKTMAIAKPRASYKPITA